MSDEELVDFARKFIAGSRIVGRWDLQKKNKGLYGILERRKLLSMVGLRKKQRSWAAMNDEELVRFSRVFIAGMQIDRRSGLAKRDIGLYHILRNRNLLDRIGLEKKRRDWAAMSDEELVSLAKDSTAENGIGKRGELAKADQALYLILIRRKLLDEVGLEGKQENWAVLGTDGLIAYAKAFIAKMGIEGRMELLRHNPKLYDALRTRKLLDSVFSDIESSKHVEAVQGVLDALESFGDDP